MMVPSHIQEALKSVSIIGRMAMATSCLEQVVIQLQLTSPRIIELLDLLWRYVETDDLGEWDEQLTKMLNDIQWQNIGKNVLVAHSEFAHLPKFVLRMIDETIEVGGANLYTGVDGYSLYTLIPLINVLNLALENGFKIPPVEPFLKSKFSDHHGWGYSVPREFFNNSQ